MLEALPGLRQPAHFYTWATRIMINACYALERGRSRVVPIGDHPAAAGREGGDFFPGDSRWADYQDVRSALCRLSEKHRTAVVLRYLEDMSVAEVAQVLGVPEGTVKSRLHHALKQLRTVLGVSAGASETGGAASE
ncbi:MAG: RNA polymerase sigma factor [Bacillota bacterium]